MNVADFIGAVRLLKARRLLVETLMTESDIAENVGMSDIQAFSTAFTAATGLTPAAFRDWHGVANRIGTTLADESIRAAASPHNPAGAPDESNDTGQR